MYKPDIGDPVEAARSREAEYLLLVTVYEMSSTETGKAGLGGTPVRAAIEIEASLLSVNGGAALWQTRIAEESEAHDILTVDSAILYTDTCLGGLADSVAGQVAVGCAVAAGAKPAETDSVETAEAEGDTGEAP